MCSHHTKQLKKMRSLCFWILILLQPEYLSLSVLSSDKFSRDDFPPNFIFGSGTTAYQVEGAASEDGRTPSIWDTYAAYRYPGETGDVACDEYHKYKEDVQLMAETGLDAYRFSISWSRLIPSGRGPINPKGLQYYNNLIDELISHGIQPHVTLHSYDLPQVLEDEYGGWLSRNVIQDFTAYADVCFREFGDRVSFWTTLNEGNIMVLGGYDLGLLPPGRCSSSGSSTLRKCSSGNSSYEPYLATHNMLLAHASVAKLYRETYKGKQHGFVGMNLYVNAHVPHTNTKEDMDAAKRAFDFYTGWFLDPLVHGDYPETMKKNAAPRIPTFTSLESEQVKGSFDFIGFNYYTNVTVKDNPGSLMSEPRDMLADSAVSILGVDLFAASNFPVVPSALQGVLENVKDTYGNPPVFIHENGQRSICNSSMDDVTRVEYLHGYIGGVLDALRNGSNVRGYMSWSFMDLFELLDGYKSCYGLYYVDRKDPDLKRYPKLSAHWYSRFLKGRSISRVGTIELKNTSIFSVADLFE